MALCDGTVSAVRFRSVAGVDLGLATKRAIDCLLNSSLESMPSSASRSMGLLFVSHLRKIWCARAGAWIGPGAHCGVGPARGWLAGWIYSRQQKERPQPEDLLTSLAPLVTDSYRRAAPRCYLLLLRRAK